MSFEPEIWISAAGIFILVLVAGYAFIKAFGQKVCAVCAMPINEGTVCERCQRRIDKMRHEDE